MLFEFPNLMSNGLLPILPGKKNIIGFAHLPMSYGNLSNVTDYAGTTRSEKAVENGSVTRDLAGSPA